MAIVNINETRKTQALADARREEIMRHFHPAGYGTTLSVKENPVTRQWDITGYRFSSCD